MGILNHVHSGVVLNILNGRPFRIFRTTHFGILNILNVRSFRIFRIS